MRRTRIVRHAISAVLMIVALLLAAPVAFAYDENDPASTFTEHLDAYGHLPCQSCHGFKYGSVGAADCRFCHGEFGAGTYAGQGNGKGPHGLYVASADRCRSCHTVHEAPSSNKLLAAATTTGTCFACHDGTGGRGVYGTIKARGGSVGASHSIDTTDATDVVPGGNAGTGGARTQAFRGAGGKMGCSDCHSPHDAETVNEFPGDRQRTSVQWQEHNEQSTKLLRQRPTGATTPTAEYGSDWCAGCHNGRVSGGMVVNHPVETSATHGADAFVYRSAAILASADTTTAATVLGPIGGVNRAPHVISGPMHTSTEPADAWGMNRGYLMPYPRTTGAGGQAGHAPICQQCHEDSRNVGSLSPDGSAARSAPMVISSEDGQTSTDNPRYQNFPHETVNAKMLVEPADDLCLNCHPLAVLP